VNAIANGRTLAVLGQMVDHSLQVRAKALAVLRQVPFAGKRRRLWGFALKPFAERSFFGVRHGRGLAQLALHLGCGIFGDVNGIWPVFAGRAVWQGLVGLVAGNGVAGGPGDPPDLACRPTAACATANWLGHAAASNRCTCSARGWGSGRARRATVVLCGPPKSYARACRQNERR
jgi:hypothetical protein